MVAVHQDKEKRFRFSNKDYQKWMLHFLRRSRWVFNEVSVRSFGDKNGVEKECPFGCKPLVIQQL